MKHLNELCCDGCRDKLAQIEQRADTASDTPAAAAQAFADRHALLMLLESLLGSVASSRLRAHAAESLLLEQLRAVAHPPTPTP